ncbi:MAG: hypothetical protein R3A10_12890 [Caldilineaceae bacterium]
MTPMVFPDNFAGLAGHLVRQMKQVLPEAEVRAAFRSMARTIAQEVDVDLDELEPEERLDCVTEFLNARVSGALGALGRGRAGRLQAAQAQLPVRRRV